MKKKIALFMAAIMSLTTVPAFGANTVSMTPLGQGATEKEGVYNGNSKTEGIAHFVDIILDEDVEAGAAFRAEIVGATFEGVEQGTSDFYSYFEYDGDDDVAQNPNVYLTGWMRGAETDISGNSVADFGNWAAVNKPTGVTFGLGGGLEPDDFGSYADYRAAVIKALLGNTTAVGNNYTATVKEIVDGMYDEIAALQTAEDLAWQDLQDIQTALAALITPSTASYAGYSRARLLELEKARKAEIAGYEAKIKEIWSDLYLMVDEAVTANVISSIGAVASGDLAAALAGDEKTPVVTTGTAASAVFSSVVNAGTTLNDKDFSRTVWSNMLYDGNQGVSVVPGVVYVKKTGDSRIMVTFMMGVDVGDDDMVVRIPLPMEITDDAESVEFNITDGGGVLSKKQYLLVDTTGGGTTTTADNEKGREIIYLDDIRIEENKVGLLDDGAFELTAPDGYRFKNRLNQVKLDTDPDAYFSIGRLDKDDSSMNYDSSKGALHTLVEENAIVWTDDDDQTSLAIYIGAVDAADDYVNTINPSSTLTSAILVQGLVIEPLDDDAVVDGEELFMEISEYEENEEDDSDDWDLFQDLWSTSAEIPTMDVTEEEFKVATTVDWGVILTAEEVVTLEAGRWAKDADDDFHTTAELTLVETEKGGWLADRTTTFTLPEGVEIRGMKITDADNLGQDNDISGPEEFDEFWDNLVDLGEFEGVDGTNAADYDVRDEVDFSQGKVSIDENVMSWKNIDVDTTDITEVKFELYLSVAPTFDGEEIAIELGGTAIVDDPEPTVVAEVLTPITLTTKVTPVQIGYQHYSVADIIIQENFAGAILEEDDGLVVSMDDDHADGGLEIRGYDELIIDGDIKIEEVDNDGENVIFDVLRASKTASTITLKGVEVYVDRTVPYGEYNITVHGESVFANRNGGALEHERQVNRGSSSSADWEDYEFARFGDPYEHPYVNLATEGAYTPLKSHVVISDGNPVVLVDNVERTMTDVVPYRTTAEGASFMVPVRFASEVFGIEEKNTLWDDASGTFTLFADGKTIQFIKNAGFYRVNGVDVQMMTGEVQVFSEVDPVAGRMYIPFRHLGRAFGIVDADITFDEATGTAHYNQPREN